MKKRFRVVIDLEAEITVAPEKAKKSPEDKKGSEFEETALKFVAQFVQNEELLKMYYWNILLGTLFQDGISLSVLIDKIGKMDSERLLRIAALGSHDPAVKDLIGYIYKNDDIEKEDIVGERRTLIESKFGKLEIINGDFEMTSE